MDNHNVCYRERKKVKFGDIEDVQLCKKGNDFCVKNSVRVF